MCIFIFGNTAEGRISDKMSVPVKGEPYVPWERSLPFLVLAITILSWYNKVLGMYQNWQMDIEKYNPT